MKGYLIRKQDIENYEGIDKTHALNEGARRINKSLGDLTGLNNIGVHLVHIPPGSQPSEKHVHYYEEECLYVLQGQGVAIIGDEEFDVFPGDFIGYRAGGEAHALLNRSDDMLVCLVAGQRLEHDVADYPDKKVRGYLNGKLGWELVPWENIQHPEMGKKA